MAVAVTVLVQSFASTVGGDGVETGFDAGFGGVDGERTVPGVGERAGS